MPEPKEGGYAGNSGADSAVIFCGNISYRASEQKIKDFFSQAGEVKEVVIALNPDDGRKRGFCNIEFSKPEEAKKAVETLNG
jgi:RNA recognition motif-containing protein